MLNAWLRLIRNKSLSAAIASLILLTVGFQNCAKVNFGQNSDNSATAVMQSSLALVVTGAGIDPAGVTTFTAVPGQTYDLKLSGVGAALTGLDNANSSMAMISGQCSGNSKYQPFTLDLTQAGNEFQFGDNSFIYSGQIVDSMGGCSWKVCAVDANGDEPACVTLIASPNSTTTTTTTLSTTTTLRPTTTTTTLRPTTTTTTLRPTTTTTTLRPTTTTTTLRPTTTTTTLRPTTTTTTLRPTTTTTTLRPTTTTTTLRPTTTTTTLRPTTTTTTLPKDTWNCQDGWTRSCGQVIVDFAVVSKNNPASAFIRTSPNIPNGTPNQYCACHSGALKTIKTDCTNLTQYYICQ